MTYRPTEQQAMKRILYFRREHDADFTGNDVNKMIADSARQAYSKLDLTGQYWISRESAMLQRKINMLGDIGALELLAAISDYVEEE